MVAQTEMRFDACPIFTFVTYTHFAVPEEVNSIC